MFEALALIGGFWFFVFVVFVLGLGIVSNEFDSFFGGAVTLVVLAAGAQAFDVPVWQSIVANPLLVIVGLLVYTAIGIIYAVYIRYANFLHKRADDIKSSWKRFQQNNPKTTHDDFRRSSEYKQYTPAYNATKIMSWCMMWPWGVLWDLSHKPVRWIYNNMYSVTSHLLERVSNRISDKILNEKK